MKIFAIMLVKNEADIVASVLNSASSWADKIFILDNGSDDGSWEIIQSMKNEIITPVRQDFRPFSRGIRAEIYNEFKHLSSNEDWWCLALDADEFYIDNPKTFLFSIPKTEHLVLKKSLDYYITEEDITESIFTDNFENNKKFIKYIKKECWSEPRFFRYRENLVWNPSEESQYPIHAGIISYKHILVKHYQFRSPQQMQKRLDVRNSSEAKKNGLAFRHVRESDWHELLKKRRELVYDDGSYETYKSLPVRNKLKQSWIKRLAIRLGMLLKIYK
ncbi:MAG: glycosyltransferase family 2 protein [Treponema sp.]|nr:glycosyltransferase family 2 protein [Treponema sp.]